MDPFLKQIVLQLIQDKGHIPALRISTCSVFRNYRRVTYYGIAEYRIEYRAAKDTFVLTCVKAAKPDYGEYKDAIAHAQSVARSRGAPIIKGLTGKLKDSDLHLVAQQAGEVGLFRKQLELNLA